MRYMTPRQEHESWHNITMMEKSRSIEDIHQGGSFHWVGDGFHVRTMFPSRTLPVERVSPFVLLDHHPPLEYPALAQGQRGVGWHPHRGFETVTFAWQGAVAHRDTAGHSGVIQPGDVQWMTAASGVLHEEYHELAFSRQGGVFEVAQLWVNLPAKYKMTSPRYQGITQDQIPTVAVGGREKSRVRVVAGEFAGVKGPARTFTPMTILDVQMHGKDSVQVDLPPGYNAMALVATGKLDFGIRQASMGELVVFANDGNPYVVLPSQEDAHVLLLAGEPIDEPIVQYGPFVMNTQKEISEAIQDVQAGNFGPIPED